MYKNYVKDLLSVQSVLQANASSLYVRYSDTSILAYLIEEQIATLLEQDQMVEVRFDPSGETQPYPLIEKLSKNALLQMILNHRSDEVLAVNTKKSILRENHEVQQLKEKMNVVHGDIFGDLTFLEILEWQASKTDVEGFNPIPLSAIYNLPLQIEEFAGVRTAIKRASQLYTEECVFESYISEVNVSNLKDLDTDDLYSLNNSLSQLQSDFDQYLTSLSLNLESNNDKSLLALKQTLDELQMEIQLGKLDSTDSVGSKAIGFSLFNSKKKTEDFTPFTTKLAKVAETLRVQSSESIENWDELESELELLQKELQLSYANSRSQIQAKIKRIGINQDMPDAVRLAARLKTMIQTINHFNIFKQICEVNTRSLTLQHQLVNRLYRQVSQVTYLVQNKYEVLSYYAFIDNLSEEIKTIIRALHQSPTNSWTSTFDQAYIDHLIEHTKKGISSSFNAEVAKIQTREEAEYNLPDWQKFRLAEGVMNSRAMKDKKMNKLIQKWNKSGVRSWSELPLQHQVMLESSLPISLIPDETAQGIIIRSLRHDAPHTIRYVAAKQQDTILEHELRIDALSTTWDDSLPLSRINNSHLLRITKKLAKAMLETNAHFNIHQMKKWNIISALTPHFHHQVEPILRQAGAKEFFQDDEYETLTTSLLESEREHIVLCHDGLLNPSNIAYLPVQIALMSALQKLGIKVIALDSLELADKPELTIKKALSFVTGVRQTEFLQNEI